MTYLCTQTHERFLESSFCERRNRTCGLRRRPLWVARQQHAIPHARHPATNVPVVQLQDLSAAVNGVKCAAKRLRCRPFWKSIQFRRDLGRTPVARAHNKAGRGWSKPCLGTSVSSVSLGLQSGTLRFQDSEIPGIWPEIPCD